MPFGSLPSKTDKVVPCGGLGARPFLSRNPSGSTEVGRNVPLAKEPSSGIGAASSSKVTARPVTGWSPPESCISSVVRSREGPTSRISTSRGNVCVNPWSVTSRSEIEPESPSTSIW